MVVAIVVAIVVQWSGKHMGIHTRARARLRERQTLLCLSEESLSEGREKRGKRETEREVASVCMLCVRGAKGN